MAWKRWVFTFCVFWLMAFGSGFWLLALGSNTGGVLFEKMDGRWIGGGGSFVKDVSSLACVDTNVYMKIMQSRNGGGSE